MSVASTVSVTGSTKARLYDCRDAYSQALEAMAEADQRVCAVVSDSVSSTKLKSFSQKFPERFGINPRRNGKGAVNEPRGGQERPRKRGEHTFDDLPEDAQQTYERLDVQFANRGDKYTKEEYVADYQF